MKAKLKPKNKRDWIPRLTQDNVQLFARDPDTSLSNPLVKSVNEGHSIILLDGEKLTLQAVC